jgi:hypothetical protein
VVGEGKSCSTASEVKFWGAGPQENTCETRVEKAVVWGAGKTVQHLFAAWQKDVTRLNLITAIYLLMKGK